MKTALITGISGQDGAYLSKLLLEKGYRVIGGDRRTASGSLWRLDELGVLNDIDLIDFELAELTNIQRVIEKNHIDELYNLAAQSFVKASFEMPLMTSDITGIGVVRILESIRKINPSIKFYQASSSEMFGKVVEIPQTENTPFYPRSPYAVSKLFAHCMTINYREAYNLHAVSGILFNHESPLRGEEFVTRKITIGFAKIKNGDFDCLELGNLDASRDWGFAGDYVKGMWMMLNNDIPQDYVLSTGMTHTIKEYIEEVSQYYDFNILWNGTDEEMVGIDTKSNKEIIKINPKYYRPTEVDILKGNPSKAQNELGWKNEVNFKELAKMMAESDLKKYYKK
ncbi:MAG: GDP-mannose 4,6-dehydratase [Candidatus Marinimicrobia bacterium]|jgi:GDPmannose 4,6-dehydratase|nr:GDP-mannose 4,6-dehydratase [Candidatus Neomarinimicrobiota bacterium]